MPYLEDGETWDDNPDVYEDGMAENRPGHKKFSEYKLPKWTKHPLSHPTSGMSLSAKDFHQAAGDGFMNPLGWTIAHVACKFGDIDMLEMCTPEELNSQSYEGHTPASYAIQHGTPWCLQWLVEHGADTTTPDYAGLTPEETIWRNPRLHNNEMEWCFQAIKGELSEKNSQKAQEYRLVKHRPPVPDASVTEKLDRDMLKLRKYWFNSGDYKFTYQVPSPQELAARPVLDLPSSKVTAPKKQLPPLPVALLFPGQGSQYVGMLKDVADKPKVKEMLRSAKAILGWDVQELCLNGPEEKLGESRYCQPAMFVACLAALEVLRESKPEVVNRAQAVAGLSLGEYAALVAADVLSFEDGLQLVNLRAQAMQDAIDMVPGAQCSVAGLPREKVDMLCAEALKVAKSEPKDCKVATFLFPAGFICSGNKECIDQLCKLAVAQKALQAKVMKIGGAYHSTLMRPAEEALATALQQAKAKMKPPRCGIYFNSTAKLVKAGSDPSEITQFLQKQLTNEVLWEPTVKAMIIDQVRDFYECGPLKQLKAMIKRIDADAFKRTENIGV